MPTLRQTALRSADMAIEIAERAPLACCLELTPTPYRGTLQMRSLAAGREDCLDRAIRQSRCRKDGSLIETPPCLAEVRLAPRGAGSAEFLPYPEDAATMIPPTLVGSLLGLRCPSSRIEQSHSGRLLRVRAKRWPPRQMWDRTMVGRPVRRVRRSERCLLPEPGKTA
jgi:hypothetical protein